MFVDVVAGSRSSASRRRWARRVDPHRGTVGFRVRQVFGSYVDVVGCWIHFELNGCDGVPTFQEGSEHSMHAVHDAAIGPEDDRVLHFYLVGQANMLRNLSWRHRFRPIHRVKLEDRREWSLLDWQIARESDETVDIPRVETGCPSAEVVLRSHRLSSAPSVPDGKAPTPVRADEAMRQT